MRPIRALLIDDNPDDRALTLRALRAEVAMEAREVLDRDEFEAALKEARFDLAVIDYKLNWSTGLELLPLIRKRWPRCPVIMFTATGSEEIAVEAMKQGLDDYVLKSPKHFARLRAAAVAALKRTREESRARVREARLTRALRRREEDLLQARRLEAVGRLAGGVAHDFNNLLTTINGYSEMLLDMMGNEHPFRSMVQEIRSAGARAAQITGQLLAFGRRQFLQPRLIDLNAVIRGMEEGVRRMLPAAARFEVSFDQTLGRVHADPGQIESALCQLVANACEAMPEGGTLSMATRAVRVVGRPAGEPDPKLPASLGPGAYALVTVRDTGAGMDSETRARLFEPFFTTKTTPRSTGLGLSSAFGIIKQSGGEIFATSAPGNGTAFAVYLPCADSRAAPVREPSPDTAPLLL